MNNDLISRDALKKAIEKYRNLNCISTSTIIGVRNVMYLIDNAPTVEERPQGECKTCIHRDPEDKKCDCGGQERQGCLFPVSDDYYCKYYERGKEE